jgi:glycosyltransferase involved in cell wall biosynthesis
MLGHLKRSVLERLSLALGWLKINDERVFDYQRYLRNKSPNRALLSYLPNFVIEEARGLKTSQFSNVGLALELPKILNQLGYIVDIVSWEDTKFEPSRPYDLFIGHGAKNFENIHRALRPKTQTIYFSSGSYWKFHNEQEDARLADFKKRHGVELPRDRYIYESEEFANQQAEAIICLGNADTKQTYEAFPRVYNLPIATYPDPRPEQEMTEARRKSWLFYSGGGNIHKGLDLVIDSFENTDLELYICTLLDPEFEKFYYKQLHQTKNIHYIGLVDPRSSQYYEIMEKCAFTILPSCSEGSPGSVVDCMQRGLIPVVSQAAHIDIGDFGLTLPRADVTNIRTTIDVCRKLPLEDLRLRSEWAKQAAEAYSIERFESNLKSILTEITSENV